MTVKTKIFLFALLAAALCIIFILVNGSSSGKISVIEQIIKPEIGNVRSTVELVGTVKPRNRLEVMPTVTGRVEKVLVSEGDKVRAGQTLALMSSSERAALIDAARSRGAGEVKYWEDMYKTIPIISPISGMIIVRDVEPGQSVTTTSVVLVVSDILIVRAEVDETDVGKVHNGQTAVITFDALPDVKIDGRVSHISYESSLENNVNVYEVDITPTREEAVVRSGMTANVTIVKNKAENVLIIPAEAVQYQDGQSWVTIAKGDVREKRKVITGISDGKVIEVRDGITENDSLVISEKRPDAENSGSAAFMPKRNNDGKKK